MRAKLFAAAALASLSVVASANAGNVVFNLQTDPNERSTTGQASSLSYDSGGVHLTLTGVNALGNVANVHYQDNLGIGVVGGTISRIDANEVLNLDFNRYVSLVTLSFIRDSTNESFEVEVSAGAGSFSYVFTSNHTGDTPVSISINPALGGTGFSIQNTSTGGDGFTLAGAVVAVPLPTAATSGLALMGLTALRRRRA